MIYNQYIKSNIKINILNDFYNLQLVHTNNKWFLQNDNIKIQIDAYHLYEHILNKTTITNSKIENCIVFLKFNNNVYKPYLKSSKEVQSSIHNNSRFTNESNDVPKGALVILKKDLSVNLRYLGRYKKILKQKNNFNYSHYYTFLDETNNTYSYYKSVNFLGYFKDDIKEHHIENEKIIEISNIELNNIDTNTYFFIENQMCILEQRIDFYFYLVFFIFDEKKIKYDYDYNKKQIKFKTYYDFLEYIKNKKTYRKEIKTNLKIYKI